jgi:PhnB protein
MSVQNLTPYIILNGTAEKAIKHYENALGAKAQGVARFSDTPDAKYNQEAGNRIMHSVLSIGKGAVMVSDSMPGTEEKIEGGVYVCLDYDDVTDMTKRFNALAEGGKVTMPLQDTFWGAKFGIVVDPFGIRWMFNCMLKKT